MAVSRKYIIFFIIFLAVAIDSYGQIRQYRWGLNVGFVQFPAWSAGSMEGFFPTPPHGEYGVNAGINLLYDLSYFTDLNFAIGSAYHQLHYHHEQDFMIRFRYSYIFLSGAANRNFRLKIRRSYHEVRVVGGLALNSTEFFNLSGFRTDALYNSTVEIPLLAQPELFGGVGLNTEAGFHLLHINFSYHISPFRTHFFVEIPGFFPVDLKYFYHYAMVNLILYPKFQKRKKKKQKWSICR